MTEQHPITPSPELVHQWHKEACKDPYHGGTFFESKTLKRIATRAAQWGADQELEACCEWLRAKYWIESELTDDLRAARRPKPLSLKEQALADLSEIGSHYIGPGTAERIDTIHRALEALPND
jgi:hypothetical protein